MQSILFNILLVSVVCLSIGCVSADADPHARMKVDLYCSTTGAAVTATQTSALTARYMQTYVKALATNHYFVRVDMTLLYGGLDGVLSAVIQIGSDTAVTVTWLKNGAPEFDVDDASDATLSPGGVSTVAGGSCVFLSESRLECFPDDALVTLQSGEERRMDQIEIGDEVRCLKGNQVSSCTVTTFTDRMVGKPSVFHRLVHAHGALELSRRHMVYVVPTNITATCRQVEIDDAALSPMPHANACYTYAERVRVGDRIAVFSKDATVMTLEPVAAIETVSKTGIISPMTTGGARIIVNNVLTTCISDAPAGEVRSVLFLLPLTQSLDTRRAQDIHGIHPYCQPFLSSVPLLKEAYESGAVDPLTMARALQRVNGTGELVEFADISAYSVLHQSLGLPVDSTVAWLAKPVLRTLFAALEWTVGRESMVDSMNRRLALLLQKNMIST